MNEAQARKKSSAKPACPQIAGRNRATTLAAGSACILFASPVLAVELGDIQLESRLGQPLRASIAYALGPNEQIAEHCVYLQAGLPAAGIPTISRATTTLTGNRIILRGDTPLREPMMNLQLMVDCPYTAHLSRDYMLLLDPPGIADQATAGDQSAASVPTAARQAAPAPVTRQRTTPRTGELRAAALPKVTTAVTGNQYRVQPGDTLSEIVSRIDNRQLNLWNSVEAIFAANPQAFANSDMDRLIAGSVLVIPQHVTGSAPAATRPVAVASTVATPSSNPASRAYGGAAEGVAREPAPTAATAVEPVTIVRSAPVPPPVAQPELQAPGEAVAAAPPAAAPEEQAARPIVSIPDTRIAQRQPEPIPVGQDDSGDLAQSWLVWLGGAGVAIFLGLLLFGRRARERFGPAAELDETQINEAVFGRRSSDRGEIEDNDELGLSAAGIQASTFELDGDLGDGRGFDSNDDIDVALDYGFTSSGDYGKEIGAAAQQGNKPADRQPRQMTVQSADQDDTGYDMSMVVDVTKQNFESSATTRDLQAIKVEPLQSDIKLQPSLDLTSEFDHQILEQDYEDEFSATQIQSMEIAKAARELQERLGQIDPDPSEISMAEDLEATAEVTAEMPSRALHDDITAEMPARVRGDEKTAEMPARSLSDDYAADSVEETDINQSLTARLPGGDSENDDFELDLDDDETAVRHSKHG